jgi:hypothetical protein
MFPTGCDKSENMKTAVIGWGSLIWDQGDLERNVGWRQDGPSLSVEFARISGGERLTLVLVDDTRPLQTYWTVSALEDLDAARRNLKDREKTPNIARIHGLTADQVIGAPAPRVVEIMREWLISKPELDGVVWTGLESNWERERGVPFSSEDALAFLRDLDNHDRAKEYITKAPAQIRTAVRQMIEAELGWTPADLPVHLFDQ